ncbi:MAG: NAD-dependent epimerase/dehydratase family protein [Gemmatimonadetes bacterium]|nr:NAD-dependent epimerase/dehydratase family protein [Gemmatimonadota bacterium]
MTQDRRDFLRSTGAIGAGLALGVAPARLEASRLSADTGRKAPRRPAAKRLLILGGTGFIGPHTVRYAVERGHEVTIFTRGRAEADIPDVERLVGDRTGDLGALKGRTWDVVLDNNARDYRWVQLTTELLKDAAEQYLFVSSISAYEGEATGYDYVDEPWSKPPIGPDSPLVSRPDGFEDGQEAEYGLTKAIGEEVAQAAFPGRATIVRPGFIVGPGDRSDRFTYWPVRIDKGGEVLAPGDGSDPVQIIDVRDLTEWIVRLAENGTAGAFNGVGLGSPLSMAGMLHGIRAITSSEVELTWVPIPFLREQEIRPYVDMPIWIPGDPLSAVDNSRAMGSGLTFRPMAVTALDTLEWHRTRPAEAQAELRVGIKPDREKEVLTVWRGKQEAQDEDP